MIFIGFLGGDAQPAYSLILDDVPMHSEAFCAQHADGINIYYIQKQKREYPNLESYWLCAANRKVLSLTEPNVGWYIIQIEYKDDDTVASHAFIAPRRYMSERECYNATAITPVSINKNRSNMTWEMLCAKPITGQL